MRNRIRATGTALALATAFATFGITGAALAGEPTTVTVPVPGPTQTVEVPGPTQTVEVPGPTQTVEVPGPTKTVTVHAKSKPAAKSESGGGSGGSSNTSNSSSSSAPAATPVAFSNTGVDTGTVPQGGVQAGAGGMSDGGTPAVLTVLLALFAFGIAATGVVVRRRAAEH